MVGKTAYLLALFLLGSLITACNVLAQPVPTLPAPSHTTTRWNVQTSLAFEALGFLNALTGDPLVASHYQVEIDRFKSRFSPDALAALDHLAAFRQDTIHSNLSGFFGIYFSTVHANTLDDLIALCEHPDSIRDALIEIDDSGNYAGTYYNSVEWDLFKGTLQDLKVIFIALRDAGFETYWEKGVLPRLRTRATEMQKALQHYDIIPVIEEYLGFALPDDQITVYLVNFVRPYGHHIVGTQFITEPDVDNAIVVQTAIHEMMHPPFNDKDPQITQAIDAMRQDAFIKRAFDSRDPKFGYNNWTYYVNEDSVRALEQLISEKFGVARPLQSRWGADEDGGMHELSVVLYTLMKQEQFPQNGEGYGSFMIRMVEEGQFTAAASQSRYDAFYARR